MALENFLEMRDTVRDPKFLLRKELSFELERRFPDRFIPRYSMVMFHHEIPYRIAFERGQLQAVIVRELTEQATELSEILPGAMTAAVETRLPRFRCEPAEAQSAISRASGALARRCLRCGWNSPHGIQRLQQVRDLVRLDHVGLEPRPQGPQAIFVAGVRSDRDGR